MRSKQTYDGAAVYRLRKLFVRLLILWEYAGKPKNILESFAGQLKNAEKVFYCPYRISGRPRGYPAAINEQRSNLPPESLLCLCGIDSSRHPIWESLDIAQA